MSKKMLIDATHPEETRVVVADGTRVEEFDFESASKKQLAGNIYLAKVTRVEPSLQAAFVDYGGNRHGFLAFNEIHPDYYQIPKADRDALIAEERAYAEAVAAAEEAKGEAEAKKRRSRKSDDADADGDADGPEAEASDEEAKPKKRSRSRSRSRRKKTEEPSTDAGTDGDAPAAETVLADEAKDEPEVVSGEAAELAEAGTTDGADAPEGDDDADGRTMAEGAGLEDKTLTDGEGGPEEGEAPADEPSDAADPAGMDVVDPDGDDADDAEGVLDLPEDDSDDPAIAEVRVPPKPRARKYKIQEVVKVRQIMLVQVVKEERGNKGAALTTYLSLAGRYCVLMPNTARGGGISRKITNAADRKKLKEIATSIDVPQGAGLIVRTAGAKRTKTDIKRDYEYLQRQWEQIRELTLKSIAPAPIYEEGDLIHRSIRDYFSRDISEVIVDGDDGYRQARDYMSLIMPEHVDAVKKHSDHLPLFARHGVESTLSAMFNPTVHLKSGGYIVIGITEALVAIDVNSGKATKEGSIEETALKTNLEAAEEVARQAKLRDLAGLIVIDFIDMDERRNNAAVEKRMKDALKTDRARIQVGRISGFGLMEMSRQRLRPGMLEATTQPCAHCHGTGLIRSDDSLALQVLRMLDEEGTRKRSREVLARVPVKVANYLLNEKREHLAAVEQRYGMAVRIEADPSLIGDDLPALEKFKTTTRQVAKAAAPVAALNADWAPSEAADEADAPVEAEARAPEPSEDGEEQPKKRRRRRSRRRGKGGAEGEGEGGESSEAPTAEEPPADAAEAEGGVTEAAPEPEAQAPAEEEKPKRSRSRSRSRKKKDEAPAEESAPAGDPSAEEAPTEAPTADAAPEPQPEPEPEAKPKRRRARAKAPAPSEPVAEAAEAAEAAMTEAPAEDAPAPEPEAEPAPEAEPSAEPEAEAPRKKRGWWSLGR
ncbi:Rne/Rng family ribonuclease [Jannaschia sp. Os4]|uniref:ribonuclease E/G n=1 Tax=Jannaschia sp. Os4 TaxID=2807617 RepID=UPI0019398306|nr:ribonuclease E/G [Jannaschia sp. Os4]MBM2576833.1 Rne/Rng family ribonuclease [Jannaschia sp. Os4]